MWDADLALISDGRKCKHILPAVQACALHGGVWQWAWQLWDADLVLIGDSSKCKYILPSVQACALHVDGLHRASQTCGAGIAVERCAGVYRWCRAVELLSVGTCTAVHAHAERFC